MPTKVSLHILPLKKAIAIIPVVIMVVFLSFLLIVNYRSQVRLRKSALSQLVYHAETQSLSLGHYFAQRRADLAAMAGSREIRMFYENRALGMSMAYGLKASLTQIDNRFENFLLEKSLGKAPVYERILLLDRNAEILSDRSSSPAFGAEDESLDTYLTPGFRHPVIHPFQRGNHLGVWVGIPFYFKEEFAGQIIAWLNPESFFTDPAFQGDTARQKRSYIYVNAKGSPLVYPTPRDGLGDLFLTARLKIPLRHSVADPDFGTVDMISIKVPVPDTEFFMMSSQPVLEVAGYIEPSLLLLAMVMIAVFVVGSIVLLWRMNARELVLTTLLEQENIRKKQIEEKNIALETEVMISNSLEKSLKESEEKFKTMSMAAQDAIIMVNNQGLISFWNRAATAIFGYSAHEAMDRDFCGILVPEQYHGMARKQFEALQKTGTGLAVGKTVELQAKNKAEALFPVELSLSAVKLDDKWQAIGIVRNISERKETEAEIENHRKNLEFLVAERTRALEKAQTELVRKAVDAGRAQLSAMVLHNIGNAITPVSVNTERLKKSSLEKIGQYLKECYSDLAAHKEGLTAYVTTHERGIQVAEYMGRLIEELLVNHAKHQKTIHSISAGIDYVAEILSLQSAYAPGRNEMKEWVNLNDLIKDALKIQESSISKRNIKVEQQLHPSPLKILIEKNKFMQVLVNFIKNSCDAMDENKSVSQHALKVSSREEDNRVIIKIADSGCGVEQGHLEDIFELGTSTKGTSGFGLYYCKTFIEENQGAIVLESWGKNKGAEVTIQFEKNTGTA